MPGTQVLCLCSLSLPPTLLPEPPKPTDLVQGSSCFSQDLPWTGGGEVLLRKRAWAEDTPPKRPDLELVC